MKTRKNRGFTLVEILIVVVILGILAAIVIPQFSDASTQANENRIKADLQTMRSQIELYKIQHNDTPPTLANFATQMTTTIGGFGPYLQQVPTNPMNQLNTLEAIATVGGGNVGWAYDETTGEIRCDSDTYTTW